MSKVEVFIYVDGKLVQDYQEVPGTLTVEQVLSEAEKMHAAIRSGTCTPNKGSQLADVSVSGRVDIRIKAEILPASRKGEIGPPRSDPKAEVSIQGEQPRRRFGGDRPEGLLSRSVEGVDGESAPSLLGGFRRRSGSDGVPASPRAGSDSRPSPGPAGPANTSGESSKSTEGRRGPAKPPPDLLARIVPATTTNVSEQVHGRSSRRLDHYEMDALCSKAATSFTVHVISPVPPNRLERTKAVAQRAADATEVVFLIDTSGSMSDEIEAVKSSCMQFADAILAKGGDLRVGLVGFDIGGHSGSGGAYSVESLEAYTIGIWGLTTPSVFRDNVQCLRVGLFGGCGCYVANADTVDIFPRVASVYSSAAARRVLVIVSDEMGDTSGLDAIIGVLRAARVTAHVLGVDGSGGAHREIARQTDGRFWDISASKGAHDFSELLNMVARVIAEGVTTRALVASAKKMAASSGHGSGARVVSTSRVGASSSGFSGEAKRLSADEGFADINWGDFSCCICGALDVVECPHCSRLQCSFLLGSAAAGTPVSCASCRADFLPVHGGVGGVARAASGKGKK